MLSIMGRFHRHVGFVRFMSKKNSRPHPPSKPPKAVSLSDASKAVKPPAPPTPAAGSPPAPAAAKPGQPPPTPAAAKATSSTASASSNPGLPPTPPATKAPSSPGQPPSTTAAKSPISSAPLANKAMPPPVSATAPAPSSPALPKPAGTTAAAAVGGGGGDSAAAGKHGSVGGIGRTMLTLIGVPLVLTGGAILAYILDDRVKEFVVKNTEPSLISKMHSLVPALGPVDAGSKTLGQGGGVTPTLSSPVKDDYELARSTELKSADLEETNGTNVLEQKGPFAEHPHNDAALQMHTLLQQKEAQLRNEYEARVDARVADTLRTEMQLRSAELQAKYEQDLIAREQGVNDKFAAERANRMVRMGDIEKKLASVEGILKWHNQQQSQSHKAHVLAASVINADEALESGEPLGPSCSSLRAFAKDDDTIAVALDAMPKDVIEHGVPTLGQLQDRFKTVAISCRRGALIPPNSGIKGHLLAFLFSSLLINRDCYDATGTSDVSVLYRASFLLQRSDLQGAVKEIESLNHDGIPYSLARDWLTDATNRLIAQQSARVLKTYASELASTRSVQAAAP